MSFEAPALLARAPARAARGCRVLAASSAAARSYAVRYTNLAVLGERRRAPQLVEAPRPGRVAARLARGALRRVRAAHRHRADAGRARERRPRRRRLRLDAGRGRRSRRGSAAAKSAMRAFLDRAPEALRVGVVAFSDEAQVVRLADRRPRGARRRASTCSARGSAPRSATRSPGPSSSRAPRPAETGERPAPPPVTDEKGRALASILLLSDGAQTRGLLSPGQGAQRAQTAGIPVYTIALGTDEGTIWPAARGRSSSSPCRPTARRSRRSRSTRAPRRSTPRALTPSKGLQRPRLEGGAAGRPREVTAAFVGAGALLLAGAIGAAFAGAPRLP